MIDNMIGIREFAAVAGVSEPVVRTWINRHGLRVIRIGRQIYIDHSDYIDWLERNKVVLGGDSLVSSDDQYVNTRAVPTGVGTKMRKIY